MVSTSLRINVDVNKDSFIKNLRNALDESTGSFNEVLGDILSHEIEGLNQHLIDRNQILKISVKVSPYYNKDIHSLKDALSQKKDYTLWYTMLEIITPSNMKLIEKQISEPKNLKWESINYGYGISRYFKFKEKIQKTQNRYEINILQLLIPKSILKSVYNSTSKSCSCATKDLRASITGAWDWHVCFNCSKCGKRYVCECFRKAFDIQLKEDALWKKSLPEREFSYYEDRGWPWAHRLGDFVKDVEYKDGICHLCTKTPSSLVFTAKMYGSDVMIKYGPYIKKLALEMGISDKEAENIIRDQIGHKRIGEGWVNETELFKILGAVIDKSHPIQREASPEWLGRLRLDFYIPSLNLAVEYHGEQHFKPIKRFGGEEAFKKGTDRDKLKKKLCKENGVKLITFKHTEKLDLESVKKKLSKYIKSIA